MKRLIVFLSLLVLIACSESYHYHGSTLINNSIVLSVFSEDGKDLLNPETPNYYKASAIKLLYEINGKIELYSSTADATNGVSLFKNEDVYRVSILLNSAETSLDTLITYIQWNSDDIDTIAAVYNFNLDKELKMYSLEKKKVWVNGKVIWEYPINSTDDCYKIIKQ